MPVNNFNITGLSQAEILEARKVYGTNELNYKKENGFLTAFISVVKEQR